MVLFFQMMMGLGPPLGNKNYWYIPYIQPFALIVWIRRIRPNKGWGKYTYLY
jgi:hypothetical protein